MGYPSRVWSATGILVTPSGILIIASQAGSFYSLRGPARGFDNELWRVPAFARDGCYRR